MANPKLTLALSHYDRHIPLFDGSVQAEGIELEVLQVVLSPTFRPMRSFGDLIPALILTHICDWLKSLRGKTGMAVNGSPRLLAMR